MANIQEIVGSNIVDKNGKVNMSDLAGKVVGIYFSAHWCPPCRGFTPELIKFYTKMKDAGKNFEVIFVSSDRDQASFNAYYNEMPWLALEFSDDEQKRKLKEKYEVRGIPTLVLVNADTGEVIRDQGRQCVMKDPEGADFPWPTK